MEVHNHQLYSDVYSFKYCYFGNCPYRWAAGPLPVMISDRTVYKINFRAHYNHTGSCMLCICSYVR